MLNLASDNVSGASQPVLDAFIAANADAEAPYGSDRHTAEAEERLASVFEHEVKVFLVATGTAATALALSALCPPWGAVFCHEESHVIDDECGAPEMFTSGAKLVGVPGLAGKMAPGALESAIARFPVGVIKASQPAAVSVSQVTECGTLYTLDAIAAIAAVAHRHDLALHLDGARFANALVSLGCTAAEMSWKAGVDVVSFGATKNGALACEAVIFFDPARAEHFAFRRKRSGHTVSKGRLLGAQMNGYLANDHWLANARQANAMAARLASGLAGVPGIRLPWPTEANEVFVVISDKVAEALNASGIRSARWFDGSSSLAPHDRIKLGEAFVRFVTNFGTTTAEIDAVVEAARAA